MSLAPRLPDHLKFEGLAERPNGVGSRIPYRLVGFTQPQRGEWYVSGSIPQAYLCRGTIPSPYWVVEPVLSDSQRHQFGVTDWMRVAKPLTVWLARDGRRAVRLLNPDQRYIGEFLLDSPLGRSALCAVLLHMQAAGYRIARQDTGEPVDPSDGSLSRLR